MYEKYYGFSEKPFNTTPDSRFFFPSNKHLEALNSLIYSINERKGFVVITGEIGVGKTTVYRTLLNKLDLKTRTAIITNTHLTCKELIAEILEEFEVEYKSGTKQKLLSQLNSYLIKQLRSDTNIVLIIDEAQNLTPKVLEEVRMLSNLETEREKLIQIILVGQPQLKQKLQEARLEQFKQRVAVYYHITALERNETQEYIFHRLNLVSLNGNDIFTPQALDLIHERSGGIPRLINLICDSALLSGYIYEVRKINEEIIQEVAKERDFNNQRAEEEQDLSPDETGSGIKIYCCPDCPRYGNCEIKWTRGIKGKEQLCCSKCRYHRFCLALMSVRKKNRKVKAN